MYSKYRLQSGSCTRGKRPTKVRTLNASIFSNTQNGVMCSFEDVIRMGQRHEIHFIAARRQVNAARQSAVKNARELRRMMGWNLIDSPNRLVSLRMQPEDRRCPRQLKRQTTLFEIPVQLVAEPRSLLFQRLISFHSFDLLQRGKPGSPAGRIRA